jgi:hypothetical protein
MSSVHDIYQYKVGHGFDVLNIHFTPINVFGFESYCLIGGWLKSSYI